MTSLALERQPSPARTLQAAPAPQPRAALVDAFGRPIRSLRVSVTDRCNLRCTYCMPPEGVPLRPRWSLLTFEELVRAVTVAVGLGVTNVRLTGGEPLLRKDLPDLVRQLGAIDGLDDLALTTNGLLLERHAQALADAGLRRLNVSLDGLDTDTFAAMTRHGGLDAVWAGIAAAAAAGIGPIRLNVVVLKGVNDHELDRWVQLAAERDLVVRFLELMPIGEGGKVWQERYVDLSAAREDLATRWPLQPVDEALGNGPSRYWRVGDGAGRVGFITPLSEPYCEACTRMRLSSSGRLRACLAYDDEVDLLLPLRLGDAAAVEEGFRRSAAGKRGGHAWERGEVTHTGMSELGG